MTVIDAAERQRALAPDCSFCVTAPAGSGKTELLIQRVLALLARVERPEQVLAITFTRKAAAEMRERIMQALRDAAEDSPCEQEHQRVTRQLAQAALAASEQRDWQLLRDMSRLNIKTIDSFCSYLTRQMPVLSSFGGQAEALDQADELYTEAVQDLFSYIGSDRPEAADLAELLLHFDNNAARLQELLMRMLARRDQWQDYMGAHHSPEESQAALQSTVEAVVAETLARSAALLAPWEDQLYDLMCYSLPNLQVQPPEDFPRPIAADSEHWRRLSRMLLTGGGQWRRRLTKNEGFPAGQGEAQDRKDHLKALIEELAGVDGLLPQLQGLAGLPDMDGNSRSWRMVLCLSHVLPLLSALLLLVFQRQGKVDHSQVAQGALQALGEEDSPTDLALRLHYSIEHILVDEFQDTAINQYQLLTRLTRGWLEHNRENPDYPRTIFIVGDGMQSIYGFRDANVALFLKAFESGFNGVVGEPLSLRCNFRSRSGIVDWVNRAFLSAFPPVDNVRLGEVSYSPAVAVQGEGATPAVQAHAFTGEQGVDEEAAFIAADIAALQAAGDSGSIAILGRTRAILVPVLRALEAQGIPYGAQDLDPLSQSPLIIDLMSLCRALANPADRVAWFALLRAPWCGLSLADLHCLGQWREGELPANPWRLLQKSPTISGLTAEGRERLLHLAACMQWAAAKRDRLSLRVWLEQLWLYLGGPACLADERQLRDAERFFELLQEADAEGRGLDPDWLQARLEQLYAAGGNSQAQVEVMTLHKAKGLEFEHVYIPALGRGGRGRQRDLLFWEEYTDPEGQPGFLLAADDHSEPDEPSLYNFLKERASHRTRLENTRLLYVGATRAVSRLVLTTTLNMRDGEDWLPGDAFELLPPPEGSLLKPIWTSFEAQMTAHPPQGPESEPEEGPRRLWRLRVMPEAPAEIPAVAADANIPQPAFNRRERHVGTVVHLALELYAEGLLPLEDLRGEAGEVRWRCELANLGLSGEELQRGVAEVLASLQATMADERQANWMLRGDYREAHSELALTWIDEQGQARDIVVDRTFIDSDTNLRWIIDYKSSQPDQGESLDAFLAREAEHYGEQLDVYRHALSSLGEEQVRCALYFTRLGRLEEIS